MAELKKKISELTPLDSPSPNGDIPISQDGVTYRVSPTNLIKNLATKRNADYIVSSFADDRPADHHVSTSGESETAINAAIDAASALPNGGSVFLKSGFYGVTNPIRPRSNVKLYSDGLAVLNNVAGWGIGVPADIIDAAPIIKDDATTWHDFEVEGITFIGDRTQGSTSCSIYLSASNDLNNPSAPVMKNLVVRNCSFRSNKLLPVKIFGLSGKVIFVENEFYDNADPGFGFNEEVIFNSNYSKDSHDNGVSLSRGNGLVTCVGNTIEDPTLYGIWMGGYNTDFGPHEFTCTGNVVRGSRYSALSLTGSPANGVVSGNYLEMSTERPMDSHMDGIEIYGDSSVKRAKNISVTGNTIVNAPRSGVALANADDISITSNLIINVGTQFKADGVTEILATDQTTNIGIFSPQLNNKRIWIDGNSIIDNRTIPFTNYDIWKIQSVASGFNEGTNFSSGMRTDRNRLELFNTRSEAGGPVAMELNGPDTNIDLELSMQGSGEFRIRHNGGGININNVNTGGSGTQSKLRLSAGAGTASIGQVTATRRDASSSSIVALSPIANGSLMANDESAPFYVRGSASANSSYAGHNGGVTYRRRAVADAATTLGTSDYIVAYTALTLGRTVTLPIASTLPGQLYIIKDEAGVCATHNLTVVVASGGTIDGSANKIVNVNLGSLTVYSNGTQWLSVSDKKANSRTGTTASSATPTINTDTVDVYSITALAAAITSFTTNLSGTPTDGQKLWVTITDNGTARAIAWGASFEASSVALPTTTVISTRLDVGFIWNSASSKWRCVATS